MNLSPHETVVSISNDVTVNAFVKNFARPSLTFDGAIENNHIVSEWGKQVPKVTLLHIGACDIANTPLGSSNLRVEFANKLKQFVTNWHMKAKQYCSDTNEFDVRIKQHKWLFVCPPDWGNFGEGKGRLNDEQYREARKRAKSGLDQKAKSLYQNLNIVLCKPRVNEPNLLGVHLRHESIRSFGKQILDAASKLMCTHCEFGEYYVPEHHTNLLENCCVRSPVAGAAGAAH